MATPAPVSQVALPDISSVPASLAVMIQGGASPALPEEERQPTPSSQAASIALPPDWPPPSFTIGANSKQLQQIAKQHETVRLQAEALRAILEVILV